MLVKQDEVGRYEWKRILQQKKIRCFAGAYGVDHRRVSTVRDYASEFPIRALELKWVLTLAAQKVQCSRIVWGLAQRAAARRTIAMLR